MSLLREVWFEARAGARDLLHQLDLLVQRFEDRFIWKD